MTPAARNPKIIWTLLIVFLAGAATGAVAMRLGLHSMLHRAVSAAETPVQAAKASRPAPRPNAAVLQRFKKELNLSPQQAEQIAIVLADYSRYYHNLQDELDDVRATGKSRIMEILEPGQREKFDRIMTELQPQLEGKQ
jgi:flagellar basal body-associated protein FliL